MSIRVLVSTFGESDADKVLLAMKSLPYDRLVLIGAEGSDKTTDFARLQRLEGMAGHEVSFKTVEVQDFMAAVDGVSDILQAQRKDPGASSGSVILNISGGSKLLGDASLFAAFRLGVESYHCDRGVVRLPLLTGVTTTDKFTTQQAAVIMSVRTGLAFNDLMRKIAPASRQSLERVLRMLRKDGVVKMELRDGGRVWVSLTREGSEAAEALRLSS